MEKKPYYISTSFVLLSSKQKQDPSHVQRVISVHKLTSMSPRKGEPVNKVWFRRSNSYNERLHLL